MLKTLLKPELVNRYKSFGWRIIMMALAGLIDVTLQSLSDFNLGSQSTIVIGLILGEVSKYVNNKVKNG